MLLAICGLERSDVSYVSQRHGRIFPDRAQYADVHDAITHRCAGVRKFIKRAALFFAPAHFVFGSALFQDAFHFGLEHLLHGEGPDVCRGTARADIDRDVMLRDGLTDGEGSADGD